MVQKSNARQKGDGRRFESLNSKFGASFFRSRRKNEVSYHENLSYPRIVGRGMPQENDGKKISRPKDG